VYGHALIPGTALLPDLPPVDVVLYYARQTRGVRVMSVVDVAGFGVMGCAARCR